MTDKLTLAAKDAEDLQVISACLQDALVRIGDIQFHSDLKRLGLLANRFRWEIEGSAPTPSAHDGRDQRFETASGHERVHCGIAFDHVRGIKIRGINRKNRSGLLNMLAIQANETGILLVFSGNAAIQIECDDIACQFRDLDEAWPTPWQPRHDEARSR